MNPVTPSTTSSATPPTAEATTGTPAAIASRIEIGRASERLARTNTSESASSSRTSRRCPSRSTCPESPSSRSSAATCWRSGPSPATIPRKGSPFRPASARTKVRGSFGACRRPTVTMVGRPCS